MLGTQRLRNARQMPGKLSLRTRMVSKQQLKLSRRPRLTWQQHNQPPKAALTALLQQLHPQPLRLLLLLVRLKSLLKMRSSLPRRRRPTLLSPSLRLPTLSSNRRVRLMTRKRLLMMPKKPSKRRPSLQLQQLQQLLLPLPLLLPLLRSLSQSQLPRANLARRLKNLLTILRLRLRRISTRPTQKLL